MTQRICALVLESGAGKVYTDEDGLSWLEVWTNADDGPRYFCLSGEADLEALAHGILQHLAWEEARKLQPQPTDGS